MATELQEARYRTLSKQLLAGGYGIEMLSYVEPTGIMIFHTPSATAQQQTDATAVAAAFDWNAPDAGPTELADTEVFTLNGEQRRFPNFAALFARRDFFQTGRCSIDRATTSTTAVNVPDLVFTVAANTEWLFSFRLRVGSTSNTGLKIALSFPTGATLRATVKGNTGAVTTISSEQMTANNTLGLTWCAAAINNGWLEIDGIVNTTTTAGDVQLRAAKVTSGTATIYQGSYFQAQRRG